MDRPLKFRIRSSRIAVYYSLFIVSVSLLAIVLADLPIILRSLLFVMVMVAGWQAIRTLRTSPWHTIEYREGRWYLYSAANQIPVNIGGKVFIGLGVISMPILLKSGRPFYLLLWPDSADEDSLRRLRIALFSIEKA